MFTLTEASHVRTTSRTRRIAIGPRRLLSPAIFVGLLIVASACASEPDDGAVGDYAPEGSSTEVLEIHAAGTFCLIEEGAEVSGSWSSDGSDVSLTAERITMGDQTITPGPDQATEHGTLEGDTITDPDGKAWVRTDDPPADCA